MARSSRRKRAKQDTVGHSDRRNHQTTRLGRGRHDSPGSVVCVMELASMLAGERFGDRPASVCPIIGSILRIYNDVIDDELRVDLYRYAAEAVGTRGDFNLQHRRAAIALTWAKPGYETRARRWGGLRKPPEEPECDSGPDGIADYVIRSLSRRHSEDAHAAMLWLLDKLIAISAPSFDELAAPPSFDELAAPPVGPAPTLSEPTTPPVPPEEVSASPPALHEPAAMAGVCVRA